MKVQRAGQRREAQRGAFLWACCRLCKTTHEAPKELETFLLTRLLPTFDGGVATQAPCGAGGASVPPKQQQHQQQQQQQQQHQQPSGSCSSSPLSGEDKVADDTSSAAAVLSLLQWVRPRASAVPEHLRAMA
jgi:hypothetical protein